MSIKSMYRVLAVLALSLNLFGVFHNLARADSCPKDLTYTLRTTDDQISDPTWKTSYSATTRNIYFALDIDGKKNLIRNYLSTSHTLKTEVFAPDHLCGGRRCIYQIFTEIIPASSEDMITCGRRYWKSLSVAGTFIQSLYGIWTADSYVDDNLVGTTSFEITP